MTLVIVVTKSGKGHKGYATTLEYLADIETGLNQFYKDVLQNNEELEKVIPKLLRNAPPKRDLVLYGKADLSTDKWTHNLMGIFVTVSGVEQDVGQTQCTVGIPQKGDRVTRRFPKTIVADDVHKDDPKFSSYRTSCSACMWNCNMTRCKLSLKVKEEEEEKKRKKLEKEKKQVMKEKEKKQETKEKEKKQETKEKEKKQVTKQKEKKQETKENEKKRKAKEEDKKQETKEKKQKKEK